MGENVTKNKAKNLMRKAILTQHKFNRLSNEASKRIDDSIKLQNRLLGEGVIECKDISHSGLNFQDEYKNDEVINTILNEIKDAICDFGGETLEGFENINKEIFNKLSLNEHCIYILIILVIILIFKGEIIKSKFFKNLLDSVISP